MYLKLCAFLAALTVIVYSVEARAQTEAAPEDTPANPPVESTEESVGEENPADDAPVEEAPSESAGTEETPDGDTDTLAQEQAEDTAVAEPAEAQPEEVQPEKVQPEATTEVTAEPVSTEPNSEPTAQPAPTSPPVAAADTPAEGQSITRSGPAPAHRWFGEDKAYEPLTFTFGGGLKLSVPALLGGTAEAVQPFAVDRDGNEFDPGAVVKPRARVGLTFDTAKKWPVRVRAHYEHDLPTGSVGGDESTDGRWLPHDEKVEQQLRKAYAEVIMGQYLQVAGGVMTSHWGLGLLANAGDKRWQPGSARFVDPRDGDRVLRGRLSTGPWFGNAGVMVVAGVDRVLDDDILLTRGELRNQNDDRGGDEAVQAVGAVMFGYGRPTHGGFYVAHRRQDSGTDRNIRATALDLFAQTEFAFGPVRRLMLAAEGIALLGTATVAGSTAFPEQDIRQLALAARANADFGGFGAAFDFLYASGDRNPDDGTINGFKADPNYEMGLIMFRQVVAAQSARGAQTAADPNLVGVPSEGFERIPTQGGVTNTIALFPRLWYRPIKGLEVYGGPLVAFAEVPVVDPFNTRINGGAARNALDGGAAEYMGTEIDVGIRYRAMAGRSRVTAGLEGGVLLVGEALKGPAASLGSIYGGRFILEYQL